MILGSSIRFYRFYNKISNLKRKYGFMLIDNKRNNKLGDVLKSHIKTNSNASIVTNHFTIHAYEELKKELRKIKNIRVICSAVST